MIKKEFIKRHKNWNFYIRIVLISTLAILGDLNVEVSEIDSWNDFFEILKSFINNPYLIGLYIATLIHSFVNTKNKDCSEGK